MNFTFQKKRDGFALAEMIVYVAIMAVMTTAIVNIVIGVTRSNKQSFVYENIKNSAITSMERITRETRSALGINYSQSAFNSNNGILSLFSKDQFGNTETIKFYLQDQKMKVDIEGIATSTGGILTLGGTKILSLVFIPIDTGNSEAIKIEMVVEGGDRDFLKNENFYSTIILRGSY